MSTELHALRRAWLALPEPDERARANARARLREEIVRESSAGHAARLSFSRLTLRGQRPRVRVLLTATLILLVLLVGAAFTFGLGLPVLDFGQAEKAPPDSRVVKNFGVLDQGAPPGMATEVIPGETRKVMTIAGNQTLWVAPTKQGGFCMDWSGEGGCDRLGTVPLNISWAIERSGGNSRSDKVFGGLPVVDQVSGYVNARWADALEIRFEDGDVIQPRVVWVSKPIEAGFFIQRIPDVHRHPGHLLSAVVALDKDRNLISQDSLNRSRDPLADALTDKRKLVAEIDTMHGPAQTWSAPTRYEGTCYWTEFEGRRSMAGCGPKGYAFDGFSVGPLRTPDDVVFAGTTSSQIATVEFRYEDGEVAKLSPHDGLILYEIPAAQFNSGHRLVALVALDANGKELTSIDQSKVGPCFEPVPEAKPKPECPR